MKKIFIILCVLCMMSTVCFAAPSPTIEKTISCNPEIEFVVAEKTEMWENIIKRLEFISKDINSYIMLEAVYITLDKPYEQVEWSLPIKMMTEYEPIVLIIDSEAIVKQEVPITEQGNVIVDFTNYEPGNYYICFYILGA